MACRTTRSMCPSFTSVPGVAVVGAEDEVARVEPLLGHRGDLRLDVVPGRARAAASPASPGAPARSRPPRACPRGRPPARPPHRPGSRSGPGSRSARRRSCPRACVAAISPSIFGSAATTPGIVHHLAEPDDPRPGHRLGDVLRPDLGARWSPAPAPRARRTASATKTLIGCTAPRRASAARPRARARSPPRAGRRTSSWCRAASPPGRTRLTVSMPDFDVHVPVAEPGDQVAPAGVDHPGLRPDHRRGVRPARGEPPRLDRDVAPGITSRECTFTQAQSRITRSAGARRAATAISSAATSGQGGKGSSRHGASFRRRRAGFKRYFRDAHRRGGRGEDFRHQPLQRPGVAVVEGTRGIAVHVQHPDQSRRHARRPAPRSPSACSTRQAPLAARGRTRRQPPLRRRSTRSMPFSPSAVGPSNKTAISSYQYSLPLVAQLEPRELISRIRFQTT